MQRITQGLVLLLALGLSVGLMSCGGDDDDENISGSYQGTLTDNTGFIANLAQLTIQQNGSSVSGIFTPFPGTQVGTGNVTGLTSGSTVTLTANGFPGPGASRCQFVFSGGVDDDQIKGNYATTDCPAVSSGLFTFDRQ
jgi:hypothetical protein